MPPSSSTTIPRFTQAERWTHRTFGILMGILLITAAFLYIPDLSGLIGRRQLVRFIHEVAGFALPIPIIVALFFKAFRMDLRRFNRWTPDDWRWLRPRNRRQGGLEVGKFNAGQKIYASFTLGMVAVMFATGAMMFFSSMFPDELRFGATYVHDWLALATAIFVAGHMYMAFRDPIARSGMRTGSVPINWAEHEHPGWARDMAATAPHTPSSDETSSDQ